MTEIVWGDRIAIDGKPDWYRGEQVKWLDHAGPTFRAHEWDDADWAVVAHEGGFRLPADHPYYLATSRGFTYWPGGDSAPADWDGGETLKRAGHTHLTADPHGPDWRRGYNGDPDNMAEYDIIGYRKRTEQPAPAIAPELVERMVRLVEDMGRMEEYLTHERYHYDDARAILSELESNPVERFKRANPGLSPDELLAKALAGGAA